MNTLTTDHIHVAGTVQGVGFRPFVYQLAAQYALAGWVRNTSGGVEIAVEGARPNLDAFARALQQQAPPLAHVSAVCVTPGPAEHLHGFAILPSLAQAGAIQPVPPDVGICPDCLRELFDPRNRRYRYPFINCTHCGPRLTIIRAVPYDRPNTTMAGFPLCAECAAEYADPNNRRFHAQPVACPACGPHLWLARAGSTNTLPSQAALAEARFYLGAGGILAVKGLGGFHLACRADDEAAVARLRARKHRGDKPLALMAADLAAVEAICQVSQAERDLLEARERPIVVLHRRPETAIAASVAPGQATLGVMLPYTPLHYLLIERSAGFPTALVMTSGNLSEEPLLTGNAEALERLAGVADAWLLHDRDIYTRCDDSVVRLVEPGIPAVLEPKRTPPATQTLVLRRARGYAPHPIDLPKSLATTSVLATGAEVKNTFCLTRDGLAFLSPHIGDLENYETLQAFEASVAHYEQLFQTQPAALAYDLHPNYMATRYALARAEREGLPALGVQHHHAHIAACLVEAGVPGDRPVIGLACDGAGYGLDGAIWGGEFLIADYNGFERPLHLAYVPLPGGDRAAREPWRMALAWLAHAGLPWANDLPPVRQASTLALDALRSQLGSGINAPPTSSLGRLFDAVAALLGIRQTVTYEGQAAIELEALAGSDEEPGYGFEYGRDTVDPAPLIEALVRDLRAGQPVATVAGRFHASVAAMLVQACSRLRHATGLNEVALSGGVWQNALLLQRTRSGLEHAGFTIYSHQRVPANDGGLALGQAAIAEAWLNKGR